MSHYISCVNEGIGHEIDWRSEMASSQSNALLRIVPVGSSHVTRAGRELVAKRRRVARPRPPGPAGQAAVFAAEEFFDGTIRNENTRRAYRHAVNQFLAWCEQRELELVRIAPRDVGQYLTSLAKKKTSIATRKQHLAALRHFFDGMVMRHAIILNPAL